MTRQTLLLFLLVFCSSTTLSAQEGPPKLHKFAREAVLGTSFDLKVQAKSDAVAKKVERQVLAEIAARSKVFSTYSKRSEVSRINALPQKDSETLRISYDLYHLLRDARRINRKSKGAFNAYLGNVLELWKTASKTNKMPSGVDVVGAVSGALSGYKVYRKKSKSYLRRRGHGSFQLDAIAKGHIMDKAANAALETGGCEAILLNIGGELIARGSRSFVVGIANPSSAEDNAKPLTSVRLKNLSIATSGGYERSLLIAGKKYNHIIDARTGRPVEQIISATVISERTCLADALATALCALTPAEGIKMIEEETRAVCLIVDSLGKEYRSKGFRSLELAADSAGTGSSELWPENHRVVVKFRLVNSSGRRRYERHFVAAWVEDEVGRRVRLLAVWAKRGDFSYLRDLDDFWRYGWILAGGGVSTKPFRAMSKATRAVGRYRLSWDGRDDQGKAVPRGKYTIRLDINREHGPHRERHTSVSVPILCEAAATLAKGKDQPELKEVEVRFEAGPRRG